ncbi:hypothetical protein ILUMI_25007 [Ignelater luminosus]|uniref:Uncharacterized protein n=1 Tax=Ignelater luminosus TaxID=2038154 RepID=A0A8K0CBE5_IGNLU|nr:hypothetical protein ILUMI_25007 [Ignelater luminosus]
MTPGDHRRVPRQCHRMEDLNGIVGSNETAYEEVVRRYGECPSVLSRNGKNMLDLCVANDLIVVNTFYPTRKPISTPEFRRREMKNQL